MSAVGEVERAACRLPGETPVDGFLVLLCCFFFGDDYCFA